LYNCRLLVNTDVVSEIILHAVKKDGNLLQFASEHLKNDKEIVLLSVDGNPESH
jgi:hypothetical protein